MSSVVIEEIPIPATLDGSAAAADFAATIEVRNVVEEAGYGTPDVRVDAERLLAAWNDPHAPHRLFVVRSDGRIVARGMIESLLDDPTGVCWLDVRVHPDAVGRGIGRAMADRLEQLAREQGHSHANVYIVSPEGPGERVVPPTGHGSLPSGNREVRFLRTRGYRLEQILRASRLGLPIDPDELRARVRASRERSGDEYRVHRWVGPSPERFLDDMAVLFTRMSTDAPQAGLEEPEDPWTAERVAEHDARLVGEESVMLTAAVEHVGTGRLVGFTQLNVPTDAARPATQEDTLVLREHRGHALGMLLKVENLEQLETEFPGRPSVLTWNADENQHMLAVNEELGFEAIGYEGAWRLDLR